MRSPKGKRQTFSAAFLLAFVAALEVERVVLEEFQSHFFLVMTARAIRIGPAPPMLTIVAMTEMANHAGKEPWPSLEVASHWFDWASIVLALSLLASFAATVVIVWLGIVKEHHWDLLRDTSNEKVAALELRAAEANVALGTAEVEIAKANVQIAEANARTKEAELRLEEFRKLAAPRGINHPVFEAAVQGKPKAPVVIWYLPDSSDGWVFSFQLFNALHSAGWDCGWPTPIPESPQGIPWRDMPRAMVAGGQPSGVTVVGSDIEMKEPAFTTLFEALGKSLNFGVYGSGGSQALPVPAGTLRLIVAGKTDPMFRPLPAPGTAPNK